MAEEPGDDREERESTASEPDGSPDADTDAGDDAPEERAATPDDDPDADADDFDDTDDATPDESADPEPEPSVETDEEFNTLTADSDSDGSDSDGWGDDGGDLSEAYGLPPSNTTDEEVDRWSPDGDEEPPAVDALESGDDPADALSPPDTSVEPEADAPASDGGYADDTPEPYDTYDDYDMGEGIADEGAPDDREMPLADHIEEMVKRLGVVVIVMAVVSGIVFPFGEDLINVLWYSYLPGTVEQCPEAAATAQDLGPGDAACPRVYHPLAVILARLKVATLAGFLVALPVFVYETYLFMRPGLYPTERRYYLASVPTSLVLAAVGVAFAHFLVIPAIFTYFVYYSDSATTIAFGLSETFDLMILLMGGFAIVFQIPLFIMLALMMGLVTRQWMADRRLIFWGVYAGLAFLFSPDPTGMAPIIVAATMITLHEGTLLLAKWTGRK